MVEADSKLARFVGLDAYRAAGGTIRADLFGDAVYLENPELLHALAGEKLQAVEQELEGRGLGLDRGQPGARLERDFRMRTDSAAAGGRAAGTARPESRDRRRSWKRSPSLLRIRNRMS